MKVIVLLQEAVLLDSVAVDKNRTMIFRRPRTEQIMAENENE